MKTKKEEKGEKTAVIQYNMNMNIYQILVISVFWSIFIRVSFLTRVMVLAWVMVLACDI